MSKHPIELFVCKNKGIIAEYAYRERKGVVKWNKKGKVVHGSMPGRVITGRHSSPLSLHYPKREVCAARLPASRDTLLSNTRSAQPSGRTSLVTPGLEWAGHPSTRARRPIPGAAYPHLSAPTRVTGGRYTTQLSENPQTRPYIRALYLSCKPYGFCLALVDSHTLPYRLCFATDSWDCEVEKVLGLGFDSPRMQLLMLLFSPPRLYLLIIRGKCRGVGFISNGIAPSALH